MTYAIIGGSGLYQFDGLDIIEQKTITTDYGLPSDTVTVGKLNGELIYFLPRHGALHSVPPHQVNYRANIAALKLLDVKKIIAVNAVGATVNTLAAGDIVIPDQLIDYTWGRDHTYSDGSGEGVEHIDFTFPFTPTLRETVITAAKSIQQEIVETGVYGCTQGPRLETAAEIAKLAKDGCTIVGMTAMPEAALAKELSMDYVSISIVANLGAGLSEVELTFEDIQAVVSGGLEKIQALIKEIVVN